MVESIEDDISISAPNNGTNEKLTSSSLPSQKEQPCVNNHDSFSDPLPPLSAIRNKRSWSQVIIQNWKALALGQLLSFILAASGAANATLHFECSISAPTFQAGLVYIILSLHLLCLLPRTQCLCRERCNYSRISGHQHPVSSNTTRSEIPSRNSDHHLITMEVEEEEHSDSSIKGSLWIYFFMAFLDVEANYCIYCAFKYTTLMSVTLFDALAIPSAMLCSRYMLSRSYQWSHYFGAAVCIVGILLNVLGDYNDQTRQEDEEDSSDLETVAFPNKVLGDVLAIIGGTLYGLNDVFAEKAVKHIGGVKEYLGFVGLFGTCICIIQSLILEREEISSLLFGSDSETCSISRGWMILGASTLFTTISYVGMSNFLVISEAALLNLSLLTGDLWSVAFTVFEEKIFPSSLFWIALVLIFLGVFIYELSPSTIEIKRSRNNIGIVV